MEEHIQNSYAQDKDGNPIYIDDVESGAKGYFCLGCSKPMQAVKRKNNRYRSYFRHHVKDVKRENRCTYQDQDHRHWLAQNHLLIEKIIKIPMVLKFSLKKEDPPMLISEADWYTSDEVKRELIVFEDENGDVKWGSGGEIDKKNMLIRADVAFFKNGKPDLLVELVATHKLSEEKKAKIRRLGINTIQIKIPKDSPENIIYSLNSTSNTKWIYNNDEATTKYLRPSGRNTEQPTEIDDEQRRFFEETFKCRATAIGNLIRGIRKCYESEQYREIESRVGGDIRRTKRNSERVGVKVQELRDRIEDNLRDQFGKEQERIERNTARCRLEVRELQTQIDNQLAEEFGKLKQELERETKRIKAEQADLERRYSSKNKQLRDELEAVKNTIKRESNLAGESGFDIERRLNEIREESKRLESDINGAVENIEQIKQRRDRIESKIQQTFENKIERIRIIARKEQDEFNDLEKKVGDLRGYISANGVAQSSERFQEHTARIQRFYSARELLSDYVENRSIYQRINKLTTSLRERAYKNWHY